MDFDEYVTKWNEKRSTQEARLCADGRLPLLERMALKTAFIFEPGPALPGGTEGHVYAAILTKSTNEVLASRS